MNTTTTEKVTSRTFSLAQASEVTGHSLGRFRYNKEQLVKLGAVINGDGWSIPETALRTMGWLEGTVKPQKKVTKVVRLEQENKELREQLQLLEQELETERNKKAGLFGFKRSR